MKKNYDFSKAVKNPYAKLSKSQLDKLGERLKNENITEEDLRTLNDYRLSFGEAHDAVISGIRTELKLEPTGRPAKSTTSISDKLKRESIRLTQIQDIAGCRLIVEDVKSQDETTTALVNFFRARSYSIGGLSPVIVIAQFMSLWRLQENALRSKSGHCYNIFGLNFVKSCLIRSTGQLNTEVETKISGSPWRT